MKLDSTAGRFLNAVKDTYDQFTIELSNPTAACSSDIYLGALKSSDSSNAVLFAKGNGKGYQRWKLIPEAPLDPCITLQGAGCKTSSASKCAAGDPKVKVCTVAAPGYYLLNDVATACSPQPGCATSGSTCSTVAGYTTKLTCVTAATAYYLDDGVPEQCTMQADCVIAGATCLTATGLTSKLTCDAADPAYYLDNGVPTECKCCTCPTGTILDTSKCTGTTTTNEAVCKGLQLVFDTSKGTADKTVSVTLGGTSPNVVVDWGDGKTVSYTTIGDKTHVYDADGTYTVEIGGFLTAYDGDCQTGIIKLISVESFGDL